MDFFVVSRRALSVVRPARAGVSLLEVLISIFVILVGLLGVAAVIPVGRFEILQAAKADRAAACGRSILEHVRTSAILNPGLWRHYKNNSGDSIPYPWPTVLRSQGYARYTTFLIDPGYLARQRDVSISAANPPDYNQADVFVQLANLRGPTFPVPTRVTLMDQNGAPMLRTGPSPPTSTLPDQSALGERFNQWSDDLLFPVPKDVNERPREMLRCLNGGNLQNEVYPPGVGIPLMASAEGQFTWMITASPEGAAPIQWTDPNDNDNVPKTYFVADQCQSYDVSVAVFYRRDVTPFLPTTLRADENKPGERLAAVSFQGGGLGGGDVTLSISSSDLGSPNAGWLDLKENDWIMLFTKLILEPATASVPERNTAVFRWYRIVALGDVAPILDSSNHVTGWQRPATLAGPDWRFNVDAAGNLPDASAYLTEGVAGVYSTVVRTGD